MKADGSKGQFIDGWGTDENGWADIRGDITCMVVDENMANLTLKRGEVKIW